MSVTLRTKEVKDPLRVPVTLRVKGLDKNVMSLDYFLTIKSHHAAREALELCETGVKLGALLTANHKLEWETDTRLAGPGIVISARSMPPNLEVYFWLDSNKDYEQGKAILVHSVGTLLRKIPGDAILRFNETIILERIGDSMLLSNTITL